MTTRQREACTALAQLVIDNLSLLPHLSTEVAVNWIAARAVEMLRPTVSMPKEYYREYRRKARDKKIAAGLCVTPTCQNKPKLDCQSCTKCLASRYEYGAKWRAKRSAERAAKRKEASEKAHQGD